MTLEVHRMNGVGRGTLGIIETGQKCVMVSVATSDETLEVHCMDGAGTGKVDTRLPVKGNSNSHGTRSVY